MAEEIVQVAVHVGEDYPHLFVSTDPGDLAWARNPESNKRTNAVIELTATQWADFRQAEDRYYEWIRKIDQMRGAP